MIKRIIKQTRPVKKVIKKIYHQCNQCDCRALNYLILLRASSKRMASNFTLDMCKIKITLLQLKVIFQRSTRCPRKKGKGPKTKCQARGCLLTSQVSLSYLQIYLWEPSLLTLCRSRMMCHLSKSSKVRFKVSLWLILANRISRCLTRKSSLKV